MAKMNHLPLRWLLPYLLLLLCVPCLSFTDPVDKAAMDDFYNSLTGKGSLPPSLPSDWCAGVNGIDCTDNGKIKIINLYSSQLAGTIPSTLGNLSSLRWLYLQTNQLAGTIPSTLGNLASIQRIFLTNNKLAGTIPSTLGNLASLQDLRLNSNQLTGSIPSTLGNLASLQLLDLDNNQLTGTIPSTLGNFASLYALYLKGTNNFCPLVDYHSWAQYTDYPGSTYCNACATSFPTCQNGGTCSGGEYQLFSCTCLPGWMGANCEIPASMSLSVIQNNDGAWKSVELFLIDQNSVALHNYQNTDGSWSGWINLATNIPMTRLSVALNTNGRLEAFALGSDHVVYHTRQDPNGPGGWNGWSSFGGWSSEIAVGTNADGRLELIASGSSSRAYHIWEDSPSSTSWSGWYTLSGDTPMKEFSVNVRPDGRMQVFALDTNQALYYTYQNAGWTNWQTLGGWSSSMVSSINLDGRLEVFAIGTSNVVFHIWQNTPNSDSWSGWSNLGSMQAQQLAVTKLANGNIILFAIGMDQAVYYTYESPGWTSWQSLGGSGVSKITAITTQAGIVQVYAVFPGDKNIRVISQLNTSNPQSWSNWTPLQ